LSGIHRLLRQGRILVDGKGAKADTRVKAGSVISVPATVPLPAPVPAPLPALALAIIFESADLIIINKPKGLAVHGERSLDTRVRGYVAGKIPPSLSFRPGPLHRLDQPTSGLIVFSKTLEGARQFSMLVRERRLVKRYLAIVDGCVEGACLWEDRLSRDESLRKTFAASGNDESQSATTRIVPLAATPALSLIGAEIITGRTHHIRAQAALHAHPLSGDRKYGGSFQAGGLLLHACTLELPPDVRIGIPHTVHAPLPEAFRRRIQELFGNETLNSLSGV
jgi:23S rRNA pseudouridine955/2504/2580 synthase